MYKIKSMLFDDNDVQKDFEENNYSECVFSVGSGFVDMVEIRFSFCDTTKGIDASRKLLLDFDDVKALHAFLGEHIDVCSEPCA